MQMVYFFAGIVQIYFMRLQVCSCVYQCEMRVEHIVWAVNMFLYCLECFLAQPKIQYVDIDIMDEASVEAGFASARAANGQERATVHCAMASRRGKTIGFDKET